MRAVQTFVIFYLVEGKKCGLLQGLQQGSCSSAAAFSELLSLQLRFLVLYAHLPFSRTLSEPEVLHVATLSQGTMQCFCSETFSSPSFLFPVTHARQRCSTAELGNICFEAGFSYQIDHDLLQSQHLCLQIPPSALSELKCVHWHCWFASTPVCSLFTLCFNPAWHS